MGLLGKISSKSTVTSSLSQKPAQKKKESKEANVLFNPSAYLAYGGDGVDRGAMMGQQAATQTFQRALAAKSQQHLRDERLPPPKEAHPLAALQSLGRGHDLKLTEKENAFVKNINFSSHKKMTELHLHQLLSPEWVNAFEQFGFDADLMQHLKATWQSSIKQQMELAVKTFKKESNIPASALLLARDSAARATGRFLTSLSMYNGVTVSVRGKYDNERREAYFEFTVPTSPNEFVSWRKALMKEYNPMREARGMSPIEMEGEHEFASALKGEIAINGLP